MTIAEKIKLNCSLVGEVKKRNECLDRLVKERSGDKNFKSAKFIVEHKAKAQKK